MGDCFSVVVGLDEELGQVGAQPDVVGSGFYGTRQGFNQGIGHPVSVEPGRATGIGVTVRNGLAVPCTASRMGALTPRSEISLLSGHDSFAGRSVRPRAEDDLPRHAPHRPGRARARAHQPVARVQEAERSRVVGRGSSMAPMRSTDLAMLVAERSSIALATMTRSR